MSGDGTETLTFERLAERDRLLALMRDLAAHVVGVHASAASPAIRTALTFEIGDAELLIGVENCRPDQVVAILDQEADRQVFVVPLDALPESPLSAPQHTDAAALTDLLASISTLRS